MKKIVSLVAAATMGMASASVMANDCPVSHAQLETALATALTANATTIGDKTTVNGGLDFDMWGAVVNRDGAICAIVKVDGADDGTSIDPWPGSRVIAAQKANTANAFSNEKLALSTANLYSAVQPGASLFGLQESNPVDVRVAYRGDSSTYGSTSDPMNGLKVGGVNVFGGGLALYDDEGNLLGAVGVSGDTSCADHNVAMRTREALGFDWGPGGVDEEGTDNINYIEGNKDLVDLENAFNHPLCGFYEEAVNDVIMTEVDSAE